jgi:hypothetical protein
LLRTSRLDASINLALEAVAGGDEVVLVDTDTTPPGCGWPDCAAPESRT